MARQVLPFQAFDGKEGLAGMEPELLQDCTVVSQPLFASSHWLGARATPRTAVEQLARDIFLLHAKGRTYDADVAGAEWWVQSRELSTSADAIDFHWDKDEELKADSNVFVCPTISTVTYLSKCGSATVICPTSISEDGSISSMDIDCLYISWPEIGKHVAFDGKFLHAAPFKGGAGLRTTFLVNIWLDRKPEGLTMFPASMVSKLSQVTALPRRPTHLEPALTFSPCCFSQNKRSAPFCQDGQRNKVPVVKAEEVLKDGKPALFFLPGYSIALPLPMQTMEDAAARQSAGCCLCSGSVQVECSPQALGCIRALDADGSEGASGQHADCVPDPDCDDPEKWITSGDTLVELGDLGAALASYTRATSLDSEDVEAWTSHGIVLRDLGQMQRAAVSFEKAAAVDPGDVDLLIYQGNALSALRKHDEAIEVFSKAVEMCWHEAGPWLSRGNEYFSIGELDRALHDYEQAIELDPDNAAAVANAEHARAQLCWEQAALESKLAPHNQLEPYLTVGLPAKSSFEPNPLHSLHCMHWLDPECCATLVGHAENFARERGGWGSSRHEDHGTMDIELSTAPALRDWFAPNLQSTILPTLSQLFGIDVARLRAREVFFVKYSAQGQSKLGPHRDGHLLSFNVLMSQPDSFSGGGTHIQALQRTVQPERVCTALTVLFVNLSWVFVVSGRRSALPLRKDAPRRRPSDARCAVHPGRVCGSATAEWRRGGQIAARVH